jgi:hypothetical protein
MLHAGRAQDTGWRRLCALAFTALKRRGSNQSVHASVVDPSAAAYFPVLCCETVQLVDTDTSLSAGSQSMRHVPESALGRTNNARAD